MLGGFELRWRVELSDVAYVCQPLDYLMLANPQHSKLNKHV